MRLQVMNHLSKFKDFLFKLLSISIISSAHGKDFLDQALKVFNERVELGLHVIIGLVDNVDEYFTVVLESTPQCLQIVINKFGELVHSII